MVPTGFRFNPTDEELIQILHQKSSGIIPAHLHFITEKNVYENEPQNLEWEYSEVVNSNERYYYCRRENDSREVMGRGWWKATSHVKTVHANANANANGGDVVGYKRPLTFHRFGKDGRKQRNDPIRTNWIMHEYSLHSTSSTEWRLCKIKYKGKEGLQLEDNIRSSHHQSSIPVQGLSSSSNQDINGEPDYYWSNYSMDNYLVPFGDNSWPWEDIDIYHNL